MLAARLRCAAPAAALARRRWPALASSRSSSCVASGVSRSSSSSRAGSSTLRSCAQRPAVARLPRVPAGAASSLTRIVAGLRHVVACSGEGATVELEVKVEGMKCGGCSSRVEAALKAMEHVKGVSVDLESKLASIEVEASSLIDAMNMLPSFVSAIKELGFEAEPHIEYQA